MRPLLIWDIDGTLLEPRGIGRAALNEAFAAMYGIAAGFDGLDFAGAADHDLWLQATAQSHVRPTADETAKFFITYRNRLEALLTRTPLRPLPGVSTLIPLLSQMGWPMVLGTGNICAGAYAKLSAAGIANYFPGGGFSQPNLTRADILQSAAAGRDPAMVIVLGDTPRDIHAAHANRFVILGVATGRFSEASLAQEGADLVLPNLGSPDQVMMALTTLANGRGPGVAP